VSIKLNPYMAFEGNTKEVMEFYHKIFGGEVTMPLEKQMWGDKFGMHWMINIGETT
jgi:uncharacterized glyoxalase superfamily protein PhnB